MGGSPAASVQVGALDLAELGFWWVGPQEDDPSGPAALLIGLLDGTKTNRIPEPVLWHHPQTNVPIVRGPAAGLVVFGLPVGGDVGADVELHVIPSATGVDRSVGLVPVTTSDIEIAPDGSAIYWIDPGPHSGVWRLDLESGARARLLPRIEVAARDGGVTLAAAVQPRAMIAVAADGRRLAALWCGVERCALQVLDLSNGATALFAINDLAVDLEGFAADGIALGGACLDPSSGMLGVGFCRFPDANAVAYSMNQNFLLGAELPPGWSLGTEPVPGAPIMSFELQAVAVPADGGAPVVLEVFGTFHGQ